MLWYKFFTFLILFAEFNATIGDSTEANSTSYNTANSQRNVFKLERLSELNGQILSFVKDNACSTPFEHWVPLRLAHFDNNGVPKGGVKAGTDGDGNDVYVARAYYEEALVPANYVPNRHLTCLSNALNEHCFRENVELLVDFDGQWTPDRNGHVPANAVVTGYTGLGEKMYSGRGYHEGFALPGKIFQSHGMLYMPYKGKEVGLREYEVLVRAPKK